MNKSYSHEEEEESSSLILSRYVEGDIESFTSSIQWSKAFEMDFDSKWEHDITVKSLNNQTDIYFLLSWEDSTKGDNETIDGAMIIFELTSDNETNDEETNIVRNGETKEVWIWDTSRQSNSDAIIDVVWEDQKWNIMFGRSISTDEQDKITFDVGVKKEDFIKIVVWDGAEGESPEQIKDLPHADFVLLPYIDTEPKDVFVWSALLVIGAVSFLLIERKLHFRKEQELK